MWRYLRLLVLQLRASALLAAQAWSPAGTSVDPAFACGSGCLGWQTATSCGVWCGAGSAYPGQVFLETIQNVCTCNARVGTWGATLVGAAPLR